ncbi:hypothetical protein [Curtobacterium sp. MWU13-2055]|nr:hypothetical protein [Curtobacterium sp. MWU13-2055]
MSPTDDSRTAAYQSWAGRSTRGGKVEVVGIDVTLDRSDATR